MTKEFFTETRLADGQIGIFYLGQVGFIIKYRDKYILIDGYLSDYVDKNCSSDAVKWIRRYPAPIDAEKLDFVDYVFCTHAHYDHADPYTLGKLNKVNKKAKYIVSAAIADTIASYGIAKENIIGLECDKKTSLCRDIAVTAIPSAHEEFHMDGNDNFLEVGFRFELGNISIYHGGDGCPYDGLEERISGCDILMLPVNGRDYYRTNVCDIIGCFDSTEAAIIAKRSGADLLIPTHFDLYDVNCINPAEFVDKLYRVNPGQKFHMFAPGERYIYSK
ncbi:MAG: MBL fold metallo-hydrolase [Clostridia bacterium]|nr:MBL fold metallo-hydrolase [Clostridia bacterium]